jgi:hypothetical protein
MAPRQTAEQRRAGGGRRRTGASNQGPTDDSAYGMALAQLAERTAAQVPPEPLAAQGRGATRLTHAVYEAQLSLLEQNRLHAEEQAARLREEEQAARLREEAQAARLYAQEQAAARRRERQRAAAAAAEERRATIQNIERGDTGIPRRLDQDMSDWSQDMLTYVNYAVPVYTLVPIIREDLYLFVRDELVTNELASRMISLPQQWDWSNGRGDLSDIVDYHVEACRIRLDELDDENDNDDRQRIAWARQPVVCTALDHKSTGVCRRDSAQTYAP